MKRPTYVELTVALGDLIGDIEAQPLITSIALRNYREIHKAATRTSNYKRQRVKCVTLGYIYENATKAAEAIGVNKAYMSLHLNNPDKYPNVKGYKFERIKD